MVFVVETINISVMVSIVLFCFFSAGMDTFLLFKKHMNQKNLAFSLYTVVRHFSI